MTRSGKAYYYLTDAIGSVIGVADDAGAKVNTYAYSPRGVTRATTSEKVAQPYQFAGGYHDATGLYHYAARYYDTNIGRFTQPDPSGQEQNPYLYAAGDPVNKIDPTGLSFLSGLSDIMDKAESVVGVVQGCIAVVGAATETGVIIYASVVAELAGTELSPLPASAPSAGPPARAGRGRARVTEGCDSFDQACGVTSACRVGRVLHGAPR
ncbi:RHS repeat-associated core domain-containing protein [Streptomyces sp. NPDC102406]|uniref:RHS repeat-associated core domain-containing protein n=1 Tax=Streptomyces sp. NPDC102406 TaxID=3366171 RepID=UPI0038032372